MGRPGRWAWALGLAGALVAGGAWAGTPGATPGEEPRASDAPVLREPEPPLSPEVPPVEPRPRFQVLPVAVSVVPGLLLHGLGPLVAGDGQTAGRLFLMQGAGLGMMLGGGVPMALTGASRQLVGPLYAVVLAGAGLLSVSTLSNLYAVVSPAFAPGQVPQRLPPLELELGYQHVADPSFSYRHFLAAGGRARWERVRLEAGVFFAPGEGNLRARAGAAYRLFGGLERARGGADGTSLDVELAGLFHNFPTEGFSLGGGELMVRGRLDMGRVSPRLLGSFAEMGAGMALQQYGFPGRVDDVLYQQLLFTFGYGVYLGGRGPFRGEALLYYDHRKDDFPGGIRTFGGGPAYFGLRGRVFLTPSWGVSADFQAGSALVGRASLVYAWGGDS